MKRAVPVALRLLGRMSKFRVLHEPVKQRNNTKVFLSKSRISKFGFGVGFLMILSGAVLGVFFTQTLSRMLPIDGDVFLHATNKDEDTKGSDFLASPK